MTASLPLGRPRGESVHCHIRAYPPLQDIYPRGIIAQTNGLCHVKNPTPSWWVRSRPVLTANHPISFNPTSLIFKGVT